MQTVYNLSIYGYKILVGLAAFFGNSKAKLWLAGRTSWTEELKSINPKNLPLAWFHAASLGEFEQARPIIETYKVKFPDHFILLSFFSPSGFEVQKKYALADQVIYLPSDTKKNAKEFIRVTTPVNIFFIKYEFWFNYLSEIKKERINCYLVSGIFRKNQHFFSFYGKWFSKKLSAFTMFFVQNNESKLLLNSIGFNNISVTGDTRLDRVQKIAYSPFENPNIEQFCENKKIVVFGSSWEKEISLASSLLQQEPDIRIIIAPHEVDAKKIVDLKKHFKGKAQLLSEASNGIIEDSNVLIIDQIGLLAKIYRFATFAVIGGGFGKGIHNTLEATVYGCPVIFGPNYSKFQEAKDLINCGAGFSIQNEKSFLELTNNFIHNNVFLNSAKQKSSEYVIKNTGATQLIFEQL